jgi:hypothetical protein
VQDQTERQTAIDIDRVAAAVRDRLLLDGLDGESDRTFMAIGAAGKATFAVILLALWGNGELPMTAGLIGLPDPALAGAFAAWLWRTR